MVMCLSSNEDVAEKAKDIRARIEELKKVLVESLGGRNWAELTTAEKNNLQPVIEELARLGVRRKELAQMIGAHEQTVYKIMKVKHIGKMPTGTLPHKEARVAEESVFKVTSSVIAKEAREKAQEYIDLGKWVEESFGKIAEDYGMDIKEFLEKAVDTWEKWHDNVDKLAEALMDYRLKAVVGKKIINMLLDGAWLWEKHLEEVRKVLQRMVELRAQGYNIPAELFMNLVMYMEGLVQSGNYYLNKEYFNYMKSLGVEESYERGEEKD